MLLQPDQKILITGARGMVGSALTSLLQKEGYYNLLTPTHQLLDCTNQNAVKKYLKENQPDVIIIAAAKVGGIYANMTYPAEFIYNNLMIASNLIHEGYKQGVKRLLNLGSTCIYPRLSTQPIVESALLSGPLEKTNEAYAIAKIAGIKLCQFYRQQYGCRYISAMPTNLYGPGDHYHLENAHVIPALIRRIHEAKKKVESEVVIWGSGEVFREFLYVNDLAEACLFLLKHYDEPEPINVGSDQEVSISQLAKLIAEVIGYEGKLIQDISKPDGTPRKKCDTSRMELLGWQAKTPLLEGLKATYANFIVG